MFNGLESMFNLLLWLAALGLGLIVVILILIPITTYKSWMPLYQCEKQYNVHKCEWVVQPILGEEIVQ